MIELEKISNGEENLNLPKSHQLELIIIKNFLLALFSEGKNLEVNDEHGCILGEAGESLWHCGSESLPAE